MPPNEGNGQVGQPTVPNQQQPTPANTQPAPAMPTNPSLPPVAAPPVQTPPHQPPPSSLYPRSTKRLFITIALAFFLLSATTLGGALALAYNNYPLVTPPQPVKETLDNLLAISPFPKPTRLIVESAFAKSATLKSADVKAELTIAADSENSPVDSVKVTVSGPAEFDKPEAKASEFDIAFDLAMEGASFNGSASVKTVEDRVYFKVNEIPFGQIYTDLLDYKNKWFYWDIPEELKDSDADKAQNEAISKLVADFIKNSQEWTTITSKDGDTYKLEVAPPKEEFVKLAYDIVSVYTEKTEDQIFEDLEKEKLKEQLEKVNDLKITASVNKDTYYLSNLSASFSILVDDFSRAQTESLLIEESMTVRFNLSIDLSNYNRQVVIIPPPDATNIEETLSQLGATIPLSPEQENLSKDAKIKNDVGAIATELQSYYTTPGNGSYPQELSKLVEGGQLEKLPTPPLETGILNYTYTKSPENCDGSAQNKCEEVSLSAPLLEPQLPGNVWCWRSTTGVAEEISQNQCSPTPQNQPTAIDSQINPLEEGLQDLIAPEETIMGEKYNWEQELIKLFSKILQ